MDLPLRSHRAGGRRLGNFGVRIPLPGLLTPGKTFLCHRNNSANQFDIRIEIRHALFGTTFTQAGVFRETTS